MADTDLWLVSTTSLELEHLVPVPALAYGSFLARGFLAVTWLASWPRTVLRTSSRTITRAVFRATIARSAMLAVLSSRTRSGARGRAAAASASTISGTRPRRASAPTASTTSWFILTHSEKAARGGFAGSISTTDLNSDASAKKLFSIQSLSCLLSIIFAGESHKAIASRDFGSIVKAWLVNDTSGINITVCLKGSSQILIGDGASKSADIYCRVDFWNEWVMYWGWHHDHGRADEWSVPLSYKVKYFSGSGRRWSPAFKYIMVENIWGLHLIFAISHKALWLSCQAPLKDNPTEMEQEHNDALSAI